MKRAYNIYLLTSILLLLSIAVFPQNTIEEAVAEIKKITHEDPYQQDRLRAQKAFDIVSARVEVLNDFSGTFLQTLPVDFWNYFTEEGNFKTRGEVMGYAREKGWSMAEVAWIIKGGQCDEHASLMSLLLQRSGVQNVKIIRSNSPHAFPVVNALPGHDPDNPWTWGKNAFVPDTWGGKIIDPLDTWYETHDFYKAIYFKEGEYSADLGSMTNRERLAEYVKRGPAWIKERCPKYLPLIRSFLKYPPEVREKLTLKPPLNICDGVPSDRLVLAETTFEIYDSKTRTYIAGQEAGTATSEWYIDKGSFRFHSRKDDFNLEIYWDQPPEVWDAFETIPIQISAISRGGPREAIVGISPVWDMTAWDIRMAYDNPDASRSSVNWITLKLEKDSIVSKDYFKEAFMDVIVTPVGKEAKVEDTFVKDGNGKFYAGKKPGEFDVFFLQINCNTLAKIKWGFVPEGSPHLKKEEEKPGLQKVEAPEYQKDVP